MTVYPTAIVSKFPQLNVIKYLITINH